MIIAWTESLDIGNDRNILGGMKTFRDMMLIIIVASLIGAVTNTIRNSTALGGLPWRTPWPDNREMKALDIPPSYQPGDSLLSLEEAYTLFLGRKAVFIDAREPAEYEEGHIQGAINLPFEQWDDYWESAKPHLSPDTETVAYCEGLDCEVSLFLARELKQLGYEKAYIFFGGWLKWKEAGLPIETGNAEGHAKE